MATVTRRGEGSLAWQTVDSGDSDFIQTVLQASGVRQAQRCTPSQAGTASCRRTVRGPAAALPPRSVKALKLRKRAVSRQTGSNAPFAGGTPVAGGLSVVGLRLIPSAIARPGPRWSSHPSKFRVCRLRNSVSNSPSFLGRAGGGVAASSQLS